MMWMLVGQRSLRGKESVNVLTAFGLGTLRLLTGLGFGIVIWLSGSLVFVALILASSDQATLLPGIVSYLAVYVPVRWVEWGIFELVLHPESRSKTGFLLGANARTRAWRLGGVVVSCLGDIPVIVSGGGLPVGPFC